MKLTLVFTLILSLTAYAYFSAHQKSHTLVNIQALHLGMSVKDLDKAFGSPSAVNRNQMTYIFDDSSELVVTLRDEEVSSAKLKFSRPLKIEDPKMRGLTLVQMNSDENNGNRPSWFFAGKPEEGLIYKITSDGVVESLTWVPPFTYGSNQAKRVGVLLKDFQSRQPLKM